MALGVKSPVLVLNVGSSSIKIAIIEERVMWKATLRWESLDAICDIDGKREKIPLGSKKEGFHFLFKKIQKLPFFDQISLIGHRVVHGGALFQKTTKLQDEDLQKLETLIDLAPLHLPANLEGIEMAKKYFPNATHFAVFDTTFHSTLPRFVYTYPVPQVWESWGVRKYGFHGISFQYCSKTAPPFLGLALENTKMVICHLGAGSSLCAIENGKSVNTTMGFSPLEGLMMATRSGSIDPSILLYLQKSKKISVDELENALNRQSGIQAIASTKDFQELEQRAEKKEAHAVLAMEMYLFHLRSFIGAMIATLNGIDLLVFTGGVGENSPFLREKVCHSFSYLGLELDRDKNEKKQNSNREISSEKSAIRVCVIPTQEESEIAQECRQCLIRT